MTKYKPIIPTSSLIALVCLLAGILAIIHFLNDVLTPFLIGLVSAYILRPSFDWLCQKGLPQAMSAILVTISGTCLFLFITLAFVPILIHEALGFLVLLPRYLETFATLYTNWSQSIVKSYGFEIPTFVLEDFLNLIQSNLPSIGYSLTRLGQIMANSFASAVSIILILAISPLTCFHALRNMSK
ncbi:MAG: AI-2E family transporter, partial [Pseudomonadota bacterium]